MECQGRTEVSTRLLLRLFRSDRYAIVVHDRGKMNGLLAELTIVNPRFFGRGQV